jgi:hypothetical protein
VRFQLLNAVAKVVRHLAEFSHCANVLEEKSVFVDDQHVLHLASPGKFYIACTFHCVRDDSLQILNLF